MSFKTRNNFEKRKNDVINILKKYPDRIPIIVESGSNGLIIDKSKYLVPEDLTLAQFLYVIRKRVNLGPEEAMYLFVNGHLLSGNSLLKLVYKNNKDPCGFLFCKVVKEATFG